MFFSLRLAPKGYGVGLGGERVMAFLLEIYICTVGLTLCKLKRKDWLLKLRSDIIMMYPIPPPPRGGDS